MGRVDPAWADALISIEGPCPGGVARFVPKAPGMAMQRAVSRIVGLDQDVAVDERLTIERISVELGVVAVDQIELPVGVPVVKNWACP